MNTILQTTTSSFNRFICLYLPADDPPVVEDWYKEHFNSCTTRKPDLFWGPKKENVVNCNFMTDEYIPGETYEMFAVRFETDCIEALYERLSKADVALEPMQVLDHEGSSFVFTDPQGNKFQVWQHPDTEPQPLRDDVPALIGISALFFPVANPEETRKWYSEAIGLELNDSGWPVTRKGQEIRFYRSLDLGQTQPYHRLWSIINVAVDDLGEIHKRSKEQGQKVEIIHDRGGCGWQFQLYDPDGNILDIWEPQTILHKDFKFDGDDSNWKQQYILGSAGFDENDGPAGGDIDSFLARVLKSELKHRRIVIPGYNVLQKLDPEGMESLLATLHHFSLEHPQHAFEIITRDWSPTDAIGPATIEEVADRGEVFIPLTERAEGILKIYGNKSNSPNWKDRIVVQASFYFVFDILSFFKHALEGRHEIFRQVQIDYPESSVPWYLEKIDPDAAREVKLAVEQFNQEHPEHAVELIE